MKRKRKNKESKQYYILVIIAVLIVVFVFGKDIVDLGMVGIFKNEFKTNLENLNEINEKYNTNLYTFPLTIEKDALLLKDLNNLKNNINEKAPEPVNLLLGIRIKLVESDIFFKEGWKYGRGSTTEFGFSCKKGLPRLRNATSDRNMSSQIGYEAVTLMNELIENYPEEAEIANVTEKQVLFLNASLSQEEKDARGDIRLIERACG